MKIRSSQRVAFSIWEAARKSNQRDTPMKKLLLTSTLILGALALAALVSRMGRMKLVRFAGGAIAACGLSLCLVA